MHRFFVLAFLGAVACASGRDDAPGDGPTDSDLPVDTAAGLTGRQSEPVVLLGASLPTLATRSSGDLVGFARRSNTWQQIAIQVDERYRADFCKVYGKKLTQCSSATPIQTIFYADPATFTGADPDPAFDKDDELAFMARDAGDRAILGAAPDGVVSTSGVEIELTDGDEHGYIYVFARADGSLAQDAGRAPLVTYAVALQDGEGNPIDYLTEYPVQGNGDCSGNDKCNPPSLEDTVVTGKDYTRHFASRWVTDALTITAAGAQPHDILDLEQSRFTPTVCGRNVLTFSTAEGAFVANIQGPIRAIRSYLGANSGPFTQRTHLFYESSEVSQTFLRVHAIPSVLALLDFASDATGMTYYNSWNTAGISIDGVPDTFNPTPPTWELVSGAYGSMVMLPSVHFSAEVAALPLAWYWEDENATTNLQCQMSQTIDAPDGNAFGTVGGYVNPNNLDTPIPITDPSRSPTPESLMFGRTTYYGAPTATTSDAVAIAGRAPLGVVTRTFGATLGADCGDGSCTDETGACGDRLCDVWEDSVGCPADCSTGTGIGAVCDDAQCDTSEDALGCWQDCWTPQRADGEDFVTCAAPACPFDLQACEYLEGCVAVTVCVVSCIADGASVVSCKASCGESVPTTGADRTQANDLLTCAAEAGCL